MENLLNSAEIVTSNLIYNRISHALAAWVQPANAVLLVPRADNPQELELADVIGHLPARQKFADLAPWLEDSAQMRAEVEFEAEDLGLYKHLINFKRPGQRSYALFLYSGAAAAESAELLLFINRTAHLLKIKEAFDSLPAMEAVQSKLKYQLSFFANAVNNIFEPYPPSTLAQLYMEIVSEMFLLPAAVTLENCNGRLRPLCSKGRSLDNFQNLDLDVAPFTQNQDLRQFPSILGKISPEHIGTGNYEQLQGQQVKVIVPLNCSDHLQYLIAGISNEAISFDYQDQISLLALGNTLNHALLFAHVRTSLLEQTRQLDRKVFSLSALYQAAAAILSARGLGDTLQITLDMIMEIFQSAVSAIFIRPPGSKRMELLRIKSALHSKSLQASLDLPSQTPDPGRGFLFYRDNADDHRYFLDCFPRFAHLEEEVQPVLIAQLFRRDSYIGFITLSERVTGEAYDEDTLKLLEQLVRSVALAVDNAFMHEQLEAAGRQLPTWD